MGREPFLYAWVSELHLGGQRFHAHLAVGRFIKRSVIAEPWGHGTVHIKMLSELRVGSGLWRSPGGRWATCQSVAKSLADARDPCRRRYTRLRVSSRHRCMCGVDLLRKNSRSSGSAGRSSHSSAIVHGRESMEGPSFSRSPHTVRNRSGRDRRCPSTANGKVAGQALRPTEAVSNQRHGDSSGSTTPVGCSSPAPGATS
jgi:hypothetical protein